MLVCSNIIRIGNSRGVIIPAKMLKSLLPDAEDKIRIEERDGEIVISRDMDLADSSFHALDTWCDEHGFVEDSVEDIEAYMDTIRSMRSNKEIKEW